MSEPMTNIPQDPPSGGSRSNIPIPDPTSLTTESLLREISHLRELLEGRVTRLKLDLDAYRDSHQLRHDELKEITAARVADITNRFQEMDRRYQQRYDSQAEAIATAFEAQQEASRTALTAADQALTAARDSAERAVLRSERLNEQRFQLKDQSTLMVSELSARIERAKERIDGVDKITDAKFVTFRTLVDSEAAKVALALAAADKAVSKAEVANEKRFEVLSDLKSSLSEQATHLMPRTETTALANSLSDRMDASLRGIESTLTDLKSRIDRQEGKSGGYQAGAGALIAGIGLIATLITIVTGIILVVN